MFKKDNNVTVSSVNAKYISNKQKTKDYYSNFLLISLASISIISILIIFSNMYLNSIFTQIFYNLIKVILLLSFITSFIMFSRLCIKYDVKKNGISKAKKLNKLYYELDKQLLDANVFVETYSRVNDQKIAKTPNIKFTWLSKENKLLIKIESSIKFYTKLEKVDLSSALDNFIVENSYFSEDRNWIIFECYEVSRDSQIITHSIEDFITNISENKYIFTIDKYTETHLLHILFTGITGSGKSYALFNLILQGLLKDWEIFIVDPKLAALKIIGDKIGQSASSIEETLELLNLFEEKRQDRKNEMKNLLTNGLDKTFSDFDLTPNILMFDEYAAFISSLKLEKKEVRDKALKIITNTILEGRQLGFFIVLSLQKSDADIVNTLIRDQMGFKAVLGDSEDMTYVTTFGQSADIPKVKVEAGRAVYTIAGKTNKPSLCYMPRFDFDILEAIEMLIARKNL